MRAYLTVTGLIFALFAVMHLYLAWQHARGGTEWWGWPALVGVVAAVLAVWAFRLLRRSPAARP